MTTTSTVINLPQEDTGCVTRRACRIYNFVGVGLFALISILVASAAGSPYYNLVVVDNNDQTTHIKATFSVSSVYIVTNMGGSQLTKKCPYTGTAAVESSIMPSRTGSPVDACPALPATGGIMTASLALNILALLLSIWMCVWMILRGLKEWGFICMTTNPKRCIMCFGTGIMGGILIALSAVPFFLSNTAFEAALLSDFGKSWGDSWGCDTYFGIRCDNYYLPDMDRSGSSTGSGLCNGAFVVGYLAVLYAIAGTWNCCCMNSTAGDTIIVTQSAPTVTTTTTTTANTYTLLIHHGAPLPTKLTITAANMQEFCGQIASSLNIGVPFAVAVFDPQFNTYASVAAIEAIPPAATIQLMFQQ